MMKIISFIILLASLFVFASCNQNGSFFKTKIENNPGELQILNESPFIGVATVGNVKEHELILFAAGGLNLSNISVSLSSSSPFSLNGGTCESSLKSGEKCKLNIRYAPTNIAAHRVDIAIQYSDSLRTRTLNYILTADSRPVLVFEYGMVYDFGNKFLGSSTDLKIKISNRGVVNAEEITINDMTAPYSFKGGSYPGTGGDCGERLTPGQTCNIVMNYSPTTNGQHLQDITLTYKKVGEIERSTLNLMAWGFNPAVLTLTASNGFDWGIKTNGDHHTATLTLTHSSGDVTASVLDLQALEAPFSRIGGTCATTLTKQAGSCTIVLDLNSSSSGTWNKNLVLSYHNGKETVLINKSLQAITKGRPVLSFSDEGTVDYGVVAKGTTQAKTFTVSYLGGELPATNISFEHITASSIFKPVGGTCIGATLSSGSCTLIATYNPTLYQADTATSTISYLAEGAKFSSQLYTFKGITEANYASSMTTNFGNVVVGQSNSRSLSLSHYGGAPITNLRISAISGPFSVDSPVCGTILNAPVPPYTYNLCSFSVGFHPTVEGSQTGTVTLELFDGLNTKTKDFPLTGVGTAKASVSIESKDFGVGSVNGPLTELVKVTNSGGKEATSLNYTLPAGVYYKGGNFPGTGGNCSNYSLGTTCNLSLVFVPSAATAQSRTLSLSYNDGVESKTATAVLTGTGQLTNELFISSYDSLNFSYVYTGYSKSVTLTLSHGGGPVPADLSSLSFNTGTDFSLTHNCPSRLESGASCSLFLKFTPQTSGARTDTLTVVYNNGSAKTTTRPVTGYGRLAMLITPTPLAFDYGTQPVGDSFETTVTFKRNSKTVSNSYSLTPTLTGAGFTYKGGSFPGTGGTCSASFGTSAFGSDTCTVVVVFTPSAVGTSYTGTLKLRYYDDNSYVDTQIVTLTGVGKAVGRLAFSPSSYDFGKVVQTQTATKTINVYNPGTLDATGITQMALNPPFSYAGGTCGASLPAGASCTLIVSYRPTGVAIENVPLTLSYYNGTYTRQVSATLIAESITQAILSLSETNPYPFGTVNVGGSIDKLFTITNSGATAATNLQGSFDSEAFTFKGGTFPGTGGTCSKTSLAAGATCSIVLSFTPTSAQNYISDFVFNYHDGLRTQSEHKELRGAGSTNLASAYYLSMIRPTSFFVSELPDFDFDPRFTVYDLEPLKKISLENDRAFYATLRRSVKSKDLFIIVDERKEKILYRIPDLLSAELHEGMGIRLLNKTQALVGIYRLQRERYELVGYEIIDLSSGRTLEKFL